MFEVSWPALEEMSESDEAEIENKRAQVVASVAPLVAAMSGDNAVRYLETGEFPDVSQSANQWVDADIEDVPEGFPELQP